MRFDDAVDLGCGVWCWWASHRLLLRWGLQSRPSLRSDRDTIVGDEFDEAIVLCARNQLVDPRSIDGADHRREVILIGQFYGT